MKVSTYYHDTDDYGVWWLVSRDEDGDPYLVLGQETPRRYLTPTQMRAFSIGLWNIAEESEA